MDTNARSYDEILEKSPEMKDSMLKQHENLEAAMAICAKLGITDPSVLNSVYQNVCKDLESEGSNSLIDKILEHLPLIMSMTKMGQPAPAAPTV